MIFGIGADMVHVPRMQKNLDRYGHHFARRILANEENTAFEQSAKPANFLAKRFAAKEAMAKAMGTGFRDGLYLSQIYLDHDEKGKPLLLCTGKALEFLKTHAIEHSHISLTDETEYVLAYVILEMAN